VAFVGIEAVMPARPVAIELMMPSRLLSQCRRTWEPTWRWPSGPAVGRRMVRTGFRPVVSRWPGSSACRA
jgi:hypothetical protein